MSTAFVLQEGMSDPFGEVQWLQVRRRDTYDELVSSLPELRLPVNRKYRIIAEVVITEVNE